MSRLCSLKVMRLTRVVKDDLQAHGGRSDEEGGSVGEVMSLNSWADHISG